MSILTEHADPRSVIVHIGKALDLYTAGEFKRTCHRLVEEGVCNFILDFSETALLDSSGLGAIFSLYRAVAPRSGVVVLAEVTKPVQVVVQMTRINRVFPHYISVHAARRALA